MSSFRRKLINISGRKTIQGLQMIYIVENADNSVVSTWGVSNNVIYALGIGMEFKLEGVDPLNEDTPIAISIKNILTGKVLYNRELKYFSNSQTEPIYTTSFKLYSFENDDDNYDQISPCTKILDSDFDINKQNKYEIIINCDVPFELRCGHFGLTEASGKDYIDKTFYLKQLYQVISKPQNFTISEDENTTPYRDDAIKE